MLNPARTELLPALRRSDAYAEGKALLALRTQLASRVRWLPHVGADKESTLSLGRHYVKPPASNSEGGDRFAEAKVRVSFAVLILAIALGASGASRRLAATQDSLPDHLTHRPAGFAASLEYTQLFPASELQASEYGDFEFRDERGRRDRPIHVWYARPTTGGTDARILFVLHGDSRTAQMARDSVARLIGSSKLIVVAPHFREAEYPGEAYDLGGIVDRGGVIQPRDQWALLVLEHLFDELRTRWALSSNSYDIVGHSAGGQFVQRLVLFVPEARFRRAVASGPGTVAFPDTAVDSPYGLRGASVTPEELVASLSRDFTLVVGERDIAEGPRPSVVLTQGSTRVSRALRLFATAHEAAVGRGVALKWRLRLVPSLDHSPMPNLVVDLEEIAR